MDGSNEEKGGMRRSRKARGGGGVGGVARFLELPWIHLPPDAQCRSKRGKKNSGVNSLSLQQATTSNSTALSLCAAAEVRTVLVCDTIW